MSTPALSCGIVITRPHHGETFFLLLRAYRYWDFPKGGVHPGEDPLAAALREAREETGLENIQFKWGTVYTETEPYARNKVARYYLGESADGDVVLGVSPELGRPEHHEFRWCRASEAEALLGDRVRRVLRWARGIVASG